MEALSSRNKEDNTFEVDAAAPYPYKILKSAVVYGANGSGKTNFIRALFAFRWFITSSTILVAGHDLPCYEPFELEDGMTEKPTRFKITFLGRDTIKYTYEISFGSKDVLLEKLEFYPNNKPAVLFERESNGTEIHEVTFGKLLRNKRISKTIFHNQLYLSRFGTSEPHEHLTQIYKYFDEMEISRSMERNNVVSISRRIAKYMTRPENSDFARRLNLLILSADDKIEEVLIEEREEEDYDEDESRANFRKSLPPMTVARPLARHAVYKETKPFGYVDFDFLKKESTGTNILFALGGLILQILDKGGILIADEFNSGLHPKLSNFLLKLFHQPSTNPNNAQLIFNTHEVTLLDKDVFRSDQIWFIEKTVYGDSEMYSAQDFDGVREDIPFDKWYMAGKFNAVPDFNNSRYLSAK